MNQNEQVLAYLLTGKSLTQAQAAEMFGVRRLGARIYDLRVDGFDIVMKVRWDDAGKPLPEYRLAPQRRASRTVTRRATF